MFHPTTWIDKRRIEICCHLIWKQSPYLLTVLAFGLFPEYNIFFFNLLLPFLFLFLSGKKELYVKTVFIVGCYKGTGAHVHVSQGLFACLSRGGPLIQDKTNSLANSYFILLYFLKFSLRLLVGPPARTQQSLTRTSNQFEFGSRHVAMLVGFNRGHLARTRKYNPLRILPISITTYHEIKCSLS